MTIITPIWGTKTFECGRNENIMDAAYRNGVEIAFGCRKGECGVCCGKLLNGTVDQSRQTFLSPSNVTKGYVITCVGRPTSDCSIKTGMSRDFWKEKFPRDVDLRHIFRTDKSIFDDFEEDRKLEE